MRFNLGGQARKVVGAACVLFAATMAGGAALAQTPVPTPVELIIDFAKIMRFDKPYKDIIIGNPGIADVTQRDGSSFVLTGRSAGVTNLIVLDKEDREILNARVRVSTDVRPFTTVFKRADRQSFICSPVCEQVVSADDAADVAGAAAQIEGRQEFAEGE